MSASSSSDKFACPKCSLSFSTVTSLRYHRRVTHRRNPFETNSLPAHCQLMVGLGGASEPPRARCGVCGRVLLPKNMDEHMKRHQLKIECKDCGRSFRCKRDLRAHRELHQSVQVVCPECGIGFKSRAVFRSHRSRCHRDPAPPKQRQCDLCGKIMHPNSFRRHMARAHKQNSSQNQRLPESDVPGPSAFTLPSSPQHSAYSLPSMPSPLLDYKSPESPNHILSL